MSAVYVSVVLIGFRLLKGFVFNIINKLKNWYSLILSSSKRYQFNWIKFRRLGIGILAFILDTHVEWRCVWVACSRWLPGSHFCLCLQSGYVYFVMQFENVPKRYSLQFYMLVDFRGIGERIGESRIFLKLWLYFRRFNAEVKAIAFVINARLKWNVCKISTCKY